MFANGGLGIDVAPQGVVTCAPGSGFTPCPVLRSATTGQVRGTACARCTVEVYAASAQADDQGHGKGKTYLGSATADAAGAWSLTLAASQVVSGQQVTASATTASPPAATSEFAANVAVGP